LLLLRMLLVVDTLSLPLLLPARPKGALLLLLFLLVCTTAVPMSNPADCSS
jgi:hypothetical protein